MQIDLIETFLDLCESHNFNRTAERLGVTQSTVSGRVRALEAGVGRILFSRGRAGAALTTEGLRFEPHARALRRAWSEALHDTRKADDRALTLRIGIQHDLAAGHVGDWLAGFRAALPDAGFYIEADYSAQMSSDLVAGSLDLAVMFTQRPHPDLHFDLLGEVQYRMISTECDHLAEVRPERYILANYSPAFAHAHATLLPGLGGAPVAGGQNAAVAAMLTALGGSAYVLAETATALVETGTCRRIADAPPLPQAVYAAIHLRHRHRAMHRRLISVLRRYVPGTAT